MGHVNTLHVCTEVQTCPQSACLWLYAVCACLSDHMHWSVCVHRQLAAEGLLPLFLQTGAEIKQQKLSLPHARQYWPQMCPDRSQRKCDGISSRCGCVFLNFDVNMICHEKMLCSCDSHGLNNRAHTYCMPIQDFFLTQ